MRTIPTRLGVVVALVSGTILAAASPAHADKAAALPEAPAADVARAIALSRRPGLALMRNAFVTPHWIGTGHDFWYRRERAGAPERVRVDAATGARRPLYDPALLSQALAAAGAPASGAAPPEVADVEADGVGAALRVVAGDQAFRCRIQPTLTCTPAPPPPDPALVVSPDKTRGAFARDGDLWLRDLATGAERRLTHDGSPDQPYATPGYDRERFLLKRLRAGKAPALEGVSWSPDGRRILVPRIDLRGVAPYPWLETSPVDGSHRPIMHTERIPLVGERPPPWEWWIVDVASGDKRQVDLPTDPTILDPRRLYRVHWSEHAARLFAIGLGHRMESRSLFAVDAATGAVRIVLTDRTLALDGAAEDQPFRLLHRDTQALWATVRDDHIHLDLVDLASGRPLRQLTGGAYTVRAILGVDEKAGRVFLVLNGREPGDPYARYLYSLGLDGRGLRLLSPEHGDHQVVDAAASNAIELQDETPPYEALSPDRRYLAYAYSTVSQPTRFVVRGASGEGPALEYERTDASALFTAGYKPPQPFTARSADGRHDLWGVVYRPTTFDPKRRYAVMDDQYVSPIAQVAPHNFNGGLTRQLHFANNPATAELGFIVVTVDGRGTPFRERSFSAPRADFLATMGLDDHIAFIRQVAAADPSLDLDRVGIAGSSFGGWTALRAMLQYPDFYKVAVAGAAPGSFYAMPEFPELTLTAGAAVYAGGGVLRPTPDATPLNWAAFDNLAQVDRLRGDLLLVIGEQDEHVLPGSTLQFYDRAVALQKNVWAIQIPNAQHNVVGYPYAMREALSFLLQHLNGTRLPPGTSFPSPVPFPLDPRQAAAPR